MNIVVTDGDAIINWAILSFGHGFLVSIYMFKSVSDAPSIFFILSDK